MKKVTVNLAGTYRIIFLVILTLAISYPVLFTTPAKGHDLEFHLQRIEGIVNDVSFSNFPVRLQSKWVNGFGCPISIFYGDIFLYLPAALRLIGLPIMPVYRIFILCINAATVIISYFSFKALFNERISLVTTALYSTAAYRLVDVYVRAALGESLTITFLPAVAACIYLIISSDDLDLRRKARIFLAFSFSSIICSHVLTTSMLIVVLIPVCVASLFLFCKKGERIRRFAELFISGILTLLISAFFTIPFLDFYLTGDIAYASDHNIQGIGLRARDLFRFFSDPFRPDGTDIQKTPGFPLMAALLVATVLCIIMPILKKRSDGMKKIIFWTVISIVILFMTSHLFPWNFIEHKLPLGSMLTAIEFPMRYLVFAILSLTLLSGDLLDMAFSKFSLREGKVSGPVMCISGLILAACIFNTANLGYHNDVYERKADFKTVEDLGKWQYYAMDYQLKNTWIGEDMPFGIKNEGMNSMEVVSIWRNDYMVACETGADYGWLQFPIFNYKYYHANDVADPSVTFEISDGSDRTVGVLLPGNYSGIVHVFWREPVLWRISELISGITAVICILLLVLPRKRVALFYDKIELIIGHFRIHR